MVSRFILRVSICTRTAEVNCAQCLSMGKSLQSFGRVFSFEENKAAVEAVTAEDLQKMSLRLFDEGTLSTLVFY